MNRREFLLGSLGKLLPQSQEPPVTQKQIVALEVRVTEGEMALQNQGNASYIRDQAVLTLLDPSLGITYYGTILRDFARDVEE